MAEPTPSQIALIKSHFADWTLTDDALAALANAANIPNPVPQGTIPRVILSADLISQLSSASLAKATRNTSFPQMHSDIVAGLRPQMLDWAGLFAKCGDITAGEYTAIVAMINATVPDPNWKAQTSWALQNLGRSADAADMWTARRAS